MRWEMKPESGSSEATTMATSKPSSSRSGTRLAMVRSKVTSRYCWR